MLHLQTKISLQPQSAQFQYKELYFIEWLAIIHLINFLSLAIPKILVTEHQQNHHSRGTTLELDTLNQVLLHAIKTLPKTAKSQDISFFNY
jgi:hypothetical protein